MSAPEIFVSRVEYSPNKFQVQVGHLCVTVWKGRSDVVIEPDIEFDDYGPYPCETRLTDPAVTLRNLADVIDNLQRGSHPTQLPPLPEVRR